MSQMPRWYRKQYLVHQLKDVLCNPYSDHADVLAGKEAVERKLDQQDQEYAQSQARKVNKYLEQL